MAVEIIPSVLAARADSFRLRLRRAERLSRIVHIDLMDGQFVQTNSLSLLAARQIQPSVRTDVHLMVAQPLDWLPLLARWPTRRVILHSELGPRLRFVLAAARANHWLIDLAINPTTPLRTLQRWIRHVHGLHVMTVRPGRYGAPFVPRMVDRIQELVKRYPRRPVAVDGSVNLKTAPGLVSAGARRLVVGSYLQRSSQPTEALAALRRAVRS